MTSSRLAARNASPAGKGLLDSAREHLDVQRRIALYVSMGAEPQTGALIDWLLASGREVLLPILYADNDLGSAAIAMADLVICPALAVDRHGVRLGRGGGSYDRALARVSPGTPVWAAVYDTEIVDQLPSDRHDQPVNAALTPTRLVPLGD